jgi:hypothetical protein
MPHVLRSATSLGLASTHDLQHLRRKVYNQVWERIDDFCDWRVLDAACVPLLHKYLWASVLLNLDNDTFSLLMPKYLLVRKSKAFKALGFRIDFCTQSFASANHVPLLAALR